MADYSWPWARGSASGVGSLPGTDITEAVKLVFGELGVPHLPELPARGPGADLIGRTAGLLSALPVEVYAGQWRVAARPGRELRRTLDLLERDLDAVTDAAEGHTGPIKVQAAGPWTLAAGLDLPIGGRMLRDHGAVSDLTASLAEGLRSHVADVMRRVPGGFVLLQLDEPTLPAVLAGRVPTESGLRTLRSVEPTVAASALRAVVGAVGVPVVMHCCAAQPPVGLFVESGAAALSLDLSLVQTPAQVDAVGTALDGGIGLFAGAVAASPASSMGRPPVSAQVAEGVVALWRQLGFPLSRLPAQVVVTPTCGLAGATPDYARAALDSCVQVGRRLAEHQD